MTGTANPTPPEVTGVELLPCPNPWCEALEREGDFSPAIVAAMFGGYRVCCTSCSLNGPTRPTREEAIAAWNTRRQSGDVDHIGIVEVNEADFDPKAVRDVEAKELLDDRAVQIVRGYGGRCRDCADVDGICPNYGLPCDPEPAKMAIRHVLHALDYYNSHPRFVSEIAAALSGQGEVPSRYGLSQSTPEGDRQ